jgi:DNA/RNA-binding domain of Phe-tRNA-synthetase-like protein
MPFRFDLTTPAANLGLKALVWIEHDLDNRATPSGLESLGRGLYTEAHERQSDCEQIIDGYRRLREQIGRSVRRFPPSPMALRGQFQRRGEIAPVSPAVDLYNLMSLVTGLSIGAHDQARVSGNARLDVTLGHELFLPLGSDSVRAVPAGEYAYLDSAERVLCRMEYRQSAQTCLEAGSRDCLFIVQGHQDTGTNLLEQTAERLSELLRRYCGARRGDTWLTP